MKSKQKETWSHWIGTHLAGNAIMGGLAGVVGVGHSLWQGEKRVGPSAALFGILGFITTLGFGRLIFEGLFGASAAKAAVVEADAKTQPIPKVATPDRQPSDYWQERVRAESAKEISPSRR